MAPENLTGFGGTFAATYTPFEGVFFFSEKNAGKAENVY